MKHKSLLLANKSKELFKSLSFLIVITIPAILSGQSPILGPGAQWIKEYWPDQETVGQNESGEDWFYDIELEKDALGTTTGYLYAGYTSYVQSDPYTIACFEYSADPNPLAFEIEGYINGFRYPKLAETDLNGNIEWYKVYESYGGQFRKIIQIEDGYVAIGQAIFSCQTDIALHYNQTMDGESEVYETLPADLVTKWQFYTSSDVDDILYVFFEDDDEDAAPYARPKEFTAPVDPYPFGGIDENGCAVEVFDEDSWASIYCPTNFLSGGSGRLSNQNTDNLLIDASLTGNFKISDTIIEVTKLESDWY